MSILRHYLNPDVLREMSEWLRGRWVAIEGIENGKRVFIRYTHRGKPLSVNNVRDLERLILANRNRLRTIYGSLNIYLRLDTEMDTEVLPNIVATTPSWDIDASINAWKYALEAARVIIEFLDRYNVKKSVYLIWSGEGVHIHINENALSNELRSRIHPFDAAYAVVEYILRIARPKLVDIVKKSEGVVKIENIVDIKRVFTAPLSIHRKLDLVAVCFSPNDIDSFDISWAKLDSYRHKPIWREYESGELDELAEVAIKEVGLRSLSLGPIHVKRDSVSIDLLRPRDEEIRVGRFEVMALLQAIRYYLLTGDLDKAKSFGLNRAIFYAWAKYYGPRSRSLASTRIEDSEARSRGRKFVDFYGEKVPVSDSGWFTMGDKEQLPEDFDRQIKSKLEIIAPWDKIWRAALEYVRRFPQHVLKDPQKFYEYVYLPVRDRFVEKVLKRYAEENGKEGSEGSSKRKSLLDFVKR